MQKAFWLAIFDSLRYFTCWYFLPRAQNELKILVREFLSANFLDELVPAERISFTFQKQFFIFSGKFQRFRKNAKWAWNFYGKSFFRRPFVWVVCTERISVSCTIRIFRFSGGQKIFGTTRNYCWKARKKLETMQKDFWLAIFDLSIFSSKSFPHHPLPWCDWLCFFLYKHVWYNSLIVGSLIGFTYVEFFFHSVP